MNRADLITIRAIKSDDYNFILSTWLKGLRHGNELFGLIEAKPYYEAYNHIIDAILKKPGTEVKVACLKDDQDVILGYSVGSPDNKAIHWVFVKSSWRSIGIARSLVPTDTRVVTHLTKAGIGIIRKKKLAYDPFLL